MIFQQQHRLQTPQPSRPAVRSLLTHLHTHTQANLFSDALCVCIRSIIEYTIISCAHTLENHRKPPRGRTYRLPTARIGRTTRITSTLDAHRAYFAHDRRRRRYITYRMHHKNPRWSGLMVRFFAGAARFNHYFLRAVFRVCVMSMRWFWDVHVQKIHSHASFKIAC